MSQMSQIITTVEKKNAKPNAIFEFPEPTVLPIPGEYARR